MNNIKKIMRATIIIGVLAALGRLILIPTARDALIAYVGIGATRIIQSLLSILAIGDLAIAGGLTAVGIVQKNNQNLIAAEAVAQRELAIEEKKKRSARLYVGDRMDADSVRTILASKLEGDWSCVANEGKSVVSQMNQMNKLQKRLHSLLVTNGANTLYDTEDALEQAEQAMCRNVRKPLNYMEIFDKEEKGIIQQMLTDAEKQNGQILVKSKEFMKGLADYLNTQGDSDHELAILDSYKDALIKISNPQ